MFTQIAVNADYQDFLLELKQFIAREGKIPAYVDMEHFKGWEAIAWLQEKSTHE